MWSMVNASTTPRPQEEFAVAIAAEDFGWKNFDVAASETGREGGNLAAHRVVHGGIANDTLLDRAAWRLELRLDQREQMAGRRGKLERDRQHVLQRDEADVDYDDIGPRRQTFARVAADIGLIQLKNPWIVTQRGMQLIRADIDGAHEA